MASNTTDTAKGPMQIDIDAVIDARLGKRAAYIPGWLRTRLKKIVCQDSLNAMLRECYPRRGAEFCRAVLDHLDISIDVLGLNRLPDPADTRVMYVCNHPLGGLDGMALIDFVARRHGVEPLFVVNDLLMAVEPLTDVFIPVNKHGGQSRGAIEGIDSAMAGNRPVIIFPAGLCSRRRDGKISDLEWQKMFIVKARESRRRIIPLRFDGHNSPRFYNYARLRERLGMKFNLEMILLPSEVFRARGKHFSIVCGAPVDPGTLTRPAREEATMMRSEVYNLKSPDNNQNEPENN